MTTAIILAGGLGTRLRSVVSDVPKPMAPVAGRPFLERQMDYWIGQGVDRFVLSVGYRHEVILSHFGESYGGTPVAYSIEASPLGTGGGLIAAMEHIDPNEPFLLLNGDTYFAVALDALRDFAASHGADWSIALFQTDDRNRYMGVGVESDGTISALQSPHSDLANGGVYWVDPQCIGSHYGPGDSFSLEDDLLPRLLESGARLMGVECAGTFIDIGVPADYERSQTLLDTTEEHV